MQDDVMDLLTQGSVWKKNTGAKAGRQAKLLFLTNVTLPDRIKEKHPIQVVYVDDENNIYNRSLPEFVEQYTFYNVDGELETRLQALFVFNEEDFVDEEEDDDEEEAELTASQIGLVNVEDAKPSRKKTFAESLLDDEDDSPAQLSMAEVLAADAGAVSQSPTVVQFSLGQNTDADPMLSVDDLSTALVAYSQEPDVSAQMIKHRLLFALSSEITIESLSEAFAPSDDLNTVDRIVVVGPHFSQLVNWTDYLGVYPEMAQGRAFATVLLGEDVRTEEAPEQEYSQMHDEPEVTTLDVTDVSDVISNIVESQTDAPPEAAAIVDEMIAELPVFDPQSVSEEIRKEIDARIETPVQPVQQAPAVPTVQTTVQNMVKNLVPNPKPGTAQ